MKALKKIWKQRWILRSIFSTIFFNFYYLPFRQAVRLPILLYKPTFAALSGKIVIDSPEIHFGMIQLGRSMVRHYPNSGITWENEHGLVTFKGLCKVGSCSSISVKKGAKLLFGNDFWHSASLKIICYKSISFGKKCRIGWAVMIMDSGIHPLYDMNKKKFKKAFGPIEIGDYNWISTQSIVMHSVTTPERCIFGLRSIITRGTEFESYAVHGGSPLKVLSRGIMRDYDHDMIYDYGNEESY